MQSFLADELVHETNVERAKQHIVRLKFRRDEARTLAENALDNFQDLPLRKATLRPRQLHFENISRLISRQNDKYAILRDYPPLTRLRNAGDPRYTQSVAALEELRSAEESIARLVRTLEARQRADLKRTAKRLVKRGDRVRFYALVLGGIAVFVGLLVGIWAIVNLRPLRRLRIAATRIAKGDYGERIDESGPEEVSHLAKEFNIMSEAVADREKEIARASRLAAAGKMAAAMTHEIRNPLSSLALNVELLCDEIDDNDESDALGKAILAEVDRLTHITEDYLRFAKFPKPVRRETDLVQIVRDTIDFHGGEFQQSDCFLKLEADEASITLLADEGQIRQMLVNLLRNAKDAMQEGGTITVRVRDEGEAILEVEDTGPGLDQEMIPHLFEPFVTSKRKGTGLGLALVHHTVTSHDGTIKAEDTGQGALFRVTLPTT